MAWILGSANHAEVDRLQKIGWDVKSLTIEFLRSFLPSPEDLGEMGADRIIAVYVDNDIEKIMTGPDWAKPKEDTLPTFEFQTLGEGEKFFVDPDGQGQKTFIKVPSFKSHNREYNSLRLSANSPAFPSLMGPNTRVQRWPSDSPAQAPAQDKLTFGNLAVSSLFHFPGYTDTTLVKISQVGFRDHTYNAVQLREGYGPLLLVPDHSEVILAEE